MTRDNRSISFPGKIGESPDDWPAHGPISEDGELPARDACDWPEGEFSFFDSPGEHDPCYVVMPGGAMLVVNHHAGEGVDVARAKFIIDACNVALEKTDEPRGAAQCDQCSEPMEGPHHPECYRSVGPAVFGEDRK